MFLLSSWVLSPPLGLRRAHISCAHISLGRSLSHDPPHTKSGWEIQPILVPGEVGGGVGEVWPRQHYICNDILERIGFDEHDKKLQCYRVSNCMGYTLFLS